jgi:hypothetical protein
LKPLETSENITKTYNLNISKKYESSNATKKAA